MTTGTDSTARSFASPLDHADAFLHDMRRQANAYRKDMLANQPVAVELWCEAAGMQPQLANAVAQWNVPVYSSGGFDSLTSKFDTAQRIIEQKDRPTVILHVGDCDPSGEAMFRAVSEDVAAFVLQDRWSHRAGVDFRRVALTQGQVRQYDLPTAPAKDNSHSSGWGGRPTAQLEALPPDVLNQIVRDAVLECLDPKQLAIDESAQTFERQQLIRALPAPGTATA